MGDIGLEPFSENSSQATDNKEVKDTPCSTPTPEKVQNQVQILQKHPELKQLIKVWPELPEHIKAAIKALIESHNKRPK